MSPGSGPALVEEALSLCDILVHALRVVLQSGLPGGCGLRVCFNLTVIDNLQDLYTE